MYAAAAESREQVTDTYRRVWAHSDAPNAPERDANRLHAW